MATRLSAKGLIEAAAACVTCGKEHKPHKSKLNPGLAPQWSDPRDGHYYQPRIGQMMNGYGTQTVAALRRLAEGES